jgi:GT2 family glycosyltransferase
MSRPLVSVILPTFQRRRLVCSAIESVLAQTFQDFELIVVDDGSTDGTAEELAAYNGRIRFRRQQNRGVAAARNLGLRLARGEIVAFLDSDDRWLPDHLEVVTTMLERQPGSVLASTCPSYRISDCESVARTRLARVLPRSLVGDFVGLPSCVAVRRQCLVAVGGFDERLRVGEDTDLWQRLAFEGPFAFLRRQTVVRGESDSTLSSTGRAAGLYLESREVSTRRLLEEVERLSTTPLELAQRVRGKLHYTRALRALDEGDAQEFRTELEAACSLLPELSTEPQLVIDGLWFLIPRTEEPGAAVDVMATAASAWPDRRSQTAVALRVHAIRLALLRGRVLLTAVLLARLPLATALRLALDRIRRRFGRRGS